MRTSGGRQTAERIIEPTQEPFDFRAILTDTDRTVYVGLVGGSDPASKALRWAQSFLRFDRLPSWFSHAFLFTGAGDGIIECRLVDADARRPENGGVWEARASRYSDPQEYPNVAVIGFQLQAIEGGVKPADRVKGVIRAARDHKGIRARYDLWAMVAAWQSFLFDPTRTHNPLAERLAHPGALLVRYALNEAGIESAPGAQDEYDAPEHIWAAAKWWQKAYEQPSVGARLSIVRCIRDAGDAAAFTARKAPRSPRSRK